MTDSTVMQLSYSFILCGGEYPSHGIQVVDLSVDEDDSVLEKTGVYVVRLLSAAGLLDDMGARSMSFSTMSRCLTFCITVQPTARMPDDLNYSISLIVKSHRSKSITPTPPRLAPWTEENSPP
jgi:hypothetical protein